MLKKSLAFTLVFALCLFTCSLCFAANDSLNNLGSDIKNVATDAGDAIRSGVGNAENGIENMAQDVGDGIKTGVENMGNTFTGGMDRRDMGTMGVTSTGDYTATRTATTGTGMSSNTWTWLIIAIAAIAIVALVWYYGTQHEDSKIDTNE